MNRSLWIAKTGLESQQMAMDVIAHNLANVNNDGFKRAHPIFEDLIYQTLRQPGAQMDNGTLLPSGLQIGTGTRISATERIHLQGALKNTGRPMDIAIDGRGFLQVELPDGTQAYTRSGSLRTDVNGQLVNPEGYVIQPPINIPENALSISIGKDGTVSVTQPGATGTSVQVGQMQLATFINNTGLQSIGDNLYLETSSSGPPNILQAGVDGAGKILQEYVEASNVNIAEELVNMIVTQRAYDMQTKAVETSDQMLARLVQTR